MVVVLNDHQNSINIRSIRTHRRSAVTFINQPSIDSIIVQIDVSKPFVDVIKELAIILHNKR